MPKKKNLQSIQDLIQYYMSLYYVMRERNPRIKFRHQEHITQIEIIEAMYHRQLDKDYPQWDSEEARGYFRQQVEFLTKVYENYERSKKSRFASATAVKA